MEKMTSPKNGAYIMEKYEMSNATNVYVNVDGK
jgi:hypothetical protein